MIDAKDIPPLAALPSLAASPAAQARFESEQHRRAAEIAAGRVPMLFLQPFDIEGRGGWNAGEIAGFDAGLADRLEGAGVATRDLKRKVEQRDVAIARVMSAGGTVAVRFRRADPPYAAGEVAGVAEDTAHRLIVAGVAEPAAAVAPLRRTLSQLRDAILGR